MRLIGGPPLVSSCCGSHWAADRPTSEKVPGPYVVRGRVLPGGVSARQGCLCGRVVLGWLLALDDDVLYLAGGVAPRDQLVQVIPVGLAR